MNSICIIECEDCGPFQVFDPGLITIFSVNNEYSAVTLCSYCERLIEIDIDENFAKQLIYNNVMFFKL